MAEEDMLQVDVVGFQNALKEKKKDLAVHQRRKEANLARGMQKF
jgi:hypothetical protein